MPSVFTDFNATTAAMLISNNSINSYYVDAEYNFSHKTWYSRKAWKKWYGLPYWLKILELQFIRLGIFISFLSVVCYSDYQIDDLFSAPNTLIIRLKWKLSKYYIRKIRSPQDVMGLHGRSAISRPGTKNSNFALEDYELKFYIQFWTLCQPRDQWILVKCWMIG